MLTLIAPGEQARLTAVRRLKILDTPRERPFDDLVAIAAQVFGTPIASIQLIDVDRLWGNGLPGGDSPREDSFCQHAVETGDEVTVIADALADPRFADHPAVTGAPHVRFYAGAPVVDAEGFPVGTVCVADTRPRRPDDGQVKTLAALARQAYAQMELRLTLEAEREQLHALRELERVRDQFISTVSHELRTPLTSIRGWLDLLLEESDRLAPDQLDSVRRVDRNTLRLSRLVDDLLDLTRADVGALSMRSEPVDLAVLTRDAVAAMTTGDAAGKLGVRASLPASVPVKGDAERLAQVIDNVCSNAVKFTPDGGDVTIQLSAEGDRALLRVVDSGIGIPTEEREHLFERFFRSSTATDARIPGTGLGLAISKAIVEHHRGTIAVGDGDGGGTAVTVTLPLAC